MKVKPATTTRLTLALYVPAFAVVFVIVRAVWLAYIRTLTESQLHQRVFDHSTAVALSLWGLSFGLAAVLARFVAVLLAKR